MAAFLKFVTLNLKAGQRDFYQLRGNTVRVVSAAVDIKIQSEDGSLDIVLKEGEQATIDDAFYRLLLWHDSGIDQLVTLSLSERGQIGSAKVSGNVTVSGAVALDAATLAALETTDIGVSSSLNYGAINASNSWFQVFAANANRRFFAIQNLDDFANLRVKFNNAASTITNGIRLEPGDLLRLDNFRYTGEVFGVMEHASIQSNNVIYWEF